MNVSNSSENIDSAPDSEAEEKNIPAQTGLSRNNLLKNFRRRRSELLLDTENSTTDTATGYNEALKGIEIQLSLSP